MIEDEYILQLLCYFDKFQLEYLNFMLFYVFQTSIAPSYITDEGFTFKIYDYLRKYDVLLYVKISNSV